MGQPVLEARHPVWSFSFPMGFFFINFLSGLLLCKTLVEMYPSLAQHHSHKFFFNRPKQTRFVLPAGPYPPSIIPETILIIKKRKTNKLFCKVTFPNLIKMKAVCIFREPYSVVSVNFQKFSDVQTVLSEI